MDHSTSVNFKLNAGAATSSLVPVAQWLDAVYQALDGLLDRYEGSVTKIETVRASVLRNKN